jgi:NADH:ubiquinone oxidoreductase subunit B-like Fe-S oxidoreductase
MFGCPPRPMAIAPAYFLILERIESETELELYHAHYVEHLANTLAICLQENEVYMVKA